MEGAVKFKQAFLPCAIALAVSAGLTGCEDSTAVTALQDLTTELSDQVAEVNEELTNLAEQLQTCMKDLAETKGEAVVITSTDATVESPSLEGEVNLAALEELKKALNETIDKQKVAMTELKTKVEGCMKDLDAAKAEAEEAAAAEAEAAAAEAEAAAAAEAEAAAAKKKTGAKKRKAEEKPAIVKEREAEGRPTTGTGSRYEKRQ
jgi:SWI/SNF-related matrix-associated actin-dependent regulator 1 of chromatin subfamily A